MQDLKLSSNLFKQGGISAVEKITFISCESKKRSYITWNNSLVHIIIDLYSIPKDELTCNTTHNSDGSSGGLNGGVHHHILAITALYLDALDDGFHACVNLFSVSVRKKIALFKCWSIIHDHQEIKFNDIKLVPKFIEHTRRRPASAVVWMFLVAVVHWNRW